MMPKMIAFQEFEGVKAFLVTGEAFEEALRLNGRMHEVKSLERLALEEPEQAFECAKAVQRIALGLEPGFELMERLSIIMNELGKAFVVVRPASFKSGLLASSEEEVARRVRECWALSYSGKALAEGRVKSSTVSVFVCAAPEEVVIKTHSLN